MSWWWPWPSTSSSAALTRTPSWRPWGSSGLRRRSMTMGSLALTSALLVTSATFYYYNERRQRREQLRRLRHASPGSVANVAELSTLSHVAEKLDATKSLRLTPRERRFVQFASSTFEGRLIMTPQDFLDSLVEPAPRPRFKRRTLTWDEVSSVSVRHSLPSLGSKGEQLFRSLGHRGMITFSEYLFLLTILIKPQSGFRIAFAMLDQDENARIDRKEFQFLESVFSSAARDRAQSVAGVNKEDELEGFYTRLLGNSNSNGNRELLTTLSLYFFGPKGDRQLKFEDFKRFMVDLQSEVLSLEFHSLSKGSSSISAIDFARLLLRYTFLNSEDYETILERLFLRLDEDEEKGISFEAFKDFCLFLNNLDDFEIALRMHTLASQSVSEDEFRRAVFVCTGRSLDKHLVHVVFQIFDDDDDGLLSYHEFVAIMRDRLHRGLRATSRLEGWPGFKKCVRKHMKLHARHD